MVCAEVTNVLIALLTLASFGHIHWRIAQLKCPLLEEVEEPPRVKRAANSSHLWMTSLSKIKVLYFPDLVHF